MEIINKFHKIDLQVIIIKAPVYYSLIGAEAIERAGIIARQADVVAGLTLEVLKGTSRAFDSGK